MKEKLMSLSQAAGLIKDGMLLAVGGNAMTRTPAIFFLELSRRPLKNLKVCGAAVGIAGDFLMAAGKLDTAYFGFFGLENEAGLSPGMRKAMEGGGQVKAMEGSCTAQIAGLRAGAYGVPFMPVGGLFGSDLVKLRPEYYQVMKSPFDGREVVCVNALVPDYAVIHVQEADKYGNARILGPEFQDILMTRAAKKTIITAEHIVGSYHFKNEPKLTSIPYFLVEAVVELPGGAKPGVCYPEYQTVDWPDHKEYQKAAKAGDIRQFADRMLEGRV